MNGKTFSAQSVDTYFWGKPLGFVKGEEVESASVFSSRLRHTYLKKPTDISIKKNVMNQLSEEDDLEQRKISVFVQNGVVKLIGTVNAYWDKFIAEEAAYNVSGVLDVKNELRVI